MIDKKWVGHERSGFGAADRAQPLAVLRQSHRRNEPDLHRPRRGTRGGVSRICRRRRRFLFAAELDSGAAFQLIEDLKIPIAKLLHGEQSFTYHRPACVGDTVTVRSTINDVYHKKNGALEFVVTSSRATNQNGEHVAELRSVIVCRH